MHAELIIKGASVVTMNPDQPRAQAVAVTKGKILAVGSDADIVEMIGPATRVVDAKGATLSPGFVEAHMHVFGGGASLGHLQLTGMKGAAMIRAAVQAHALAQPDAKVLYAQGADYDMLDGAAFDRHLLDSMVADRPLAIVTFDHHTMWVNTKALEVTGLLQGKTLGPGNEIVMGADGLATGELREVEAFGPIDVYAGEDRNSLGLSTGGEPNPAPSDEDRKADRETIKRGLDWCARHGITSIHNMDGNLYTLDLLKEIEAEGDLSCRIKVPFHFKNFMSIDMLEKASMMHETYTGDWINSGMVKVFCDGVSETYTAFMVDDYADRPGFKGDPLFSQAQFNELAIEADRRGLQIAVHSIGDGAVRRVLDGYEAARTANGPRDSRHRVEHIEVIHSDDLPRLAELGAIASMQPPHVPGLLDFPEEPARGRFGPERWHLSFAWRSVKNSGAHVVFASDWPVARVDVLAGIQAAVTRTPWEPDLPDQSFTVLEALSAYTLEGAYAEHAEDRKGQLKPGYLADLVLLSADIETIAPQEIGTVSPVLTICGGRVTYET